VDGFKRKDKNFKQITKNDFFNNFNTNKIITLCTMDNYSHRDAMSSMTDKQKINNIALLNCYDIDKCFNFKE